VRPGFYKIKGLRISRIFNTAFDSAQLTKLLYIYHHAKGFAVAGVVNYQAPAETLQINHE
jgi:hypothetical protein